MSSSIENTSSSLHRPYIGSCRNRNYISNRFYESYFSPIRSVLTKSFLSNPFKRKNYYLSNGLIIDQYGLLPISFNQGQKARSWLPSSSLHFFPSHTLDDHSPCSPIKQQQQQQQYLKNSFASTHSRVIPNENINQFNPMSSLRVNPKSSSYDQRISDQGNQYIIQLKTDDYQENDFIISLSAAQNQLIIDAKHNDEDSSGGFIRRELHKIFRIPKHIDLNNYTSSYNKNTQELTIEMPYLQSNSNQSFTFSYGDLNLTSGGSVQPIKKSNDSSTPFDFDLFHRSAFRPQIIQTPGNENKLLMSLDLGDYQPEDIKISVKDQELIVKAEKRMQTDTRKSHTSFFQSTSLPPQTDVERIQSNYIEGRLIIEAPYLHRGNKGNEQFVMKSIKDDPYRQRTETIIEFVRLRRV